MSIVKAVAVATRFMHMKKRKERAVSSAAGTGFVHEIQRWCQNG